MLKTCVECGGSIFLKKKIQTCQNCSEQYVDRKAAKELDKETARKNWILISRKEAEERIKVKKEVWMWRSREEFGEGYDGNPGFNPFPLLKTLANSTDISWIGRDNPNVRFYLSKK